ncbi:VOC family protein [Halodesulfurarchaeum sp. HSR-GB]|uniref:VOC family protein n=1 Tax=Halodesulfurarchaeum sp. HSR-GB TaxID=3074077 RepID=UPI00285FE75B|nr:VOC family protein [Halodesulfurarchaeum sp. HSR-GB]MDR5657418.1 VOC family protein [Halodesulfurarchaeum sp. HSR-GB]
MNGTLDHVMVRVSNLADSVDWYQTHLDYEEKGRHEGDGFTIVYLGPADMHPESAMLELTHNEGETPTLGDAWGHVAVRVPEGELDSAYEQLMDGGVSDYRDPESCGGKYAFVKDPDGHEIELVERDHGRLWSLDHTMLRVEDADQAIGFWGRKFEYELAGRWEADTFANYFLEPAGAAPEAMSVELTSNYDGRTYDHGDAWGHLAIRADDLLEDWEQLLTREAPAYRPPSENENRYGFTKTPSGHEIELLERDPDADSLFPF